METLTENAKELEFLKEVQGLEEGRHIIYKYYHLPFHHRLVQLYISLVRCSQSLYRRLTGKFRCFGNSGGILSFAM